MSHSEAAHHAAPEVEPLSAIIERRPFATASRVLAGPTCILALDSRTPRYTDVLEATTVLVCIVGDGEVATSTGNYLLGEREMIVLPANTRIEIYPMPRTKLMLISTGSAAPGLPPTLPDLGPL